MPTSRKAIFIGSIFFAALVIGGCDSGQNNSNSDSDRLNKNPAPEQPVSTNALTQPNPTSNPPEKSDDPLLKAIRDKGNLKSALESLRADVTFDSKGNLIRLGLDNLSVTDEATPIIAKQTRLRALYLFDTKCDEKLAGPIDLGQSSMFLEGPQGIAIHGSGDSWKGYFAMSLSNVLGYVEFSR